MTVPLSHRLVAKNGLVDYAAYVIEKATDTVALVTGTSGDEKLLPASSPKSAVPDLVQPVIPATPVEAQPQPALEKGLQTITGQTLNGIGPQAAETRNVTI